MNFVDWSFIFYLFLRHLVKKLFSCRFNVNDILAEMINVWTLEAKVCINGKGVRGMHCWWCTGSAGGGSPSPPPSSSPGRCSEQAAEPKAEQSLIIERLIKSRNHDMAGKKKISNHTSELNFGFQSRYYNDVCIISSHNQHIFSVI